MTENKSIWKTKEEKPEVATGFAEASLIIKRDNSYGVWYQLIAFYEFEEYKNVIVEWCTIADLLSLEQENQALKQKVEELEAKLKRKENIIQLGSEDVSYMTNEYNKEREQLQAKEEEIKELKDFIANEVKPVVGFYADENNYKGEMIQGKVYYNGQNEPSKTNKDNGKLARELQQKIDEVLK